MADVTAIQEAVDAMELAQLSLSQARTAELNLHEALAKAKSRALAWTPIAGTDPTWQMTAAAIIGLYESAFHDLGFFAAY